MMIKETNDSSRAGLQAQSCSLSYCIMRSGKLELKSKRSRPQEAECAAGAAKQPLGDELCLLAERNCEAPANKVRQNDANQLNSPKAASARQTTQAAIRASSHDVHHTSTWPAQTHFRPKGATLTTKHQAATSSCCADCLISGLKTALNPTDTWPRPTREVCGQSKMLRASRRAPSLTVALFLIALWLTCWPSSEPSWQRQDVQINEASLSQHSELDYLDSVLRAWTTALLRPTLIGFAQAQYRPEWLNKSLQQEIFLLNLEDGYFGCQVNESTDFLQLFELSRLCDGQSQCFQGTDEMALELKCHNRERCATHLNSRGQQEPFQCVNGVCLDGLCYCNDGWGGKSCDVPDENECKFRPCDVFAHCTNTMGSYYCSCFPGKSSLLSSLS